MFDYDTNLSLLGSGFKVVTTVGLGYTIYKYLAWLRRCRYYRSLLKDIPIAPCFERWPWPWSHCSLPPLDTVELYGNETFMDTLTKAVDGTRDSPTTPGVSKIYVLPTNDCPFVVFTNRHLIEQVLKSPQGTYRMDAPMDQAVLGMSMITLDGPDWKTRRRVMAKSFHVDMLSDYHLPINNQCKNLVDGLAELVAFAPRSTEVHFRKHAVGTSIDIAGEILFGQSLHVQKSFHKSGEYPAWVTLLMSGMLQGAAEAYNTFNFTLFKWLRPAAYKSFKHADIGFREHMITLAEQRKALVGSTSGEETVNYSKSCIIDSIIQLNKTGQLSDKDMESELLLFFAAGAETSIIVMTDGLAHLTQPENRDIVEKLMAEIDAKYPDVEDIFVSREDLDQMSYLDAVVQEMLRLAAPFPWSVRNLVKSVKISDSVTIDATPEYPVAAMFSLERMNKDTEVWGDDIDKFRPERHFKKPQNATVAAFSYGPRNCIGKHMAMSTLKVELIYLLKYFKIECADPVFDRPKEYLKSSLARRFAVEPVMTFQKRVAQ